MLLRPSSPKTTRLAKGRHRSPHAGACVMELSSMLVGETFTDRPCSVCPALAAFLRAYNDFLPPRLRQALYPWASDAVGTRDLHREVLEDRRRALVGLAESLPQVSRRPAWSDRCFCRYPDVSTAGVRAARMVGRRPELHARVDAGLRDIYAIPALALDGRAASGQGAETAQPLLLI